MSSSTKLKISRPAAEDNSLALSLSGADLPEYLLVVAGSGRMLADAAAKAGIKPLVIDLFGDADTRSSAVDLIKIPALDSSIIVSAVDYFARNYPVRHLVYGSGIEQHPESLKCLKDRIVILGNSPETVIRLQNKVEFFSVLSKLNIAYPEVAFAAPREEGQWLIKPMQGQGGAGIRRYVPDCPLKSSIYWQKFQPGTAHSVLFLADGQNAQVIGFNTQWAVSLSSSQEFIFSGVMNDCDLSAAQQSLITEWISRCVPVFGLRGLNSLDFIKTDEQCLVLEINARPSASMQLYDNVLDRHIQAVQGLFTDKKASRSGCTGMRIVYADVDWKVPAEFDWPEGCVDRPEAGAICRKGQPVCSIIAHQNNSQRVLDQLELRQQIVNNMIKVQSHGI
ncbi:MAG: ATP-grasp domain-containing protein [Methylosarcina sp.]